MPSNSGKTMPSGPQSGGATNSPPQVLQRVICSMPASKKRTIEVTIPPLLPDEPDAATRQRELFERFLAPGTYWFLDARKQNIVCSAHGARFQTVRGTTYRPGVVDLVGEITADHARRLADALEGKRGG